MIKSKLNKNLNFTANLLRGRAVDKIVEAANEGDFDLIVIGSRGLGEMQEFF